MEWFEPLIIVVAVFLVILPIAIHFVQKKDGTLKCECGHLQSECTSNCSNCSLLNKGSYSKLTYTVIIDGMRCGMCESHVNDIVRKEFGGVKVKSSSKEGIATITSDRILNLTKLKEALNNAGYEMKSFRINRL